MKIFKWFNTVDEDFLRQNFKEPAMAEPFIRGGRRRDIILMIIVGIFVLVTLAAIVYGYVQKTIVAKEQQELVRVESQTAACIQDAQTKMATARYARTQAEEFNRKVQEQLKECGKKPNKTGK